MRGGRGRGRGRGRRGTATTTAGAAASTNQTEADDCVNPEIESRLDIDGDVTIYFVGTVSFEAHLAAQKKNRNRYIAGLTLLHSSGVEISSNAKTRALAAAWARNDKELANSLLSLRKEFTLAEVLKAATLLDSGRQIRELERKVRRLEIQATLPVVERGDSKPPRKIKSTRLKTAIDNLTANKPSEGSLSGGVCKQIHLWARSFTTEELQFFALHMPKELWCKLADLVHFNPARDFAALPWFLPYCFGKAAPEDSVVSRGSNVTAENVNSLLQEIALPFAHVKPHLNILTELSKASIVRGEDCVDRGIWWYQELQCPAVDQEIQKRLMAGEQIKLNYGKLMERLLTFRLMNNCPSFYDLMVPFAEQKLKTINLELEAPIAVLADASSSMNVAIRTATIISSLLTAFTTARLIFFNNKQFEAESSPKTTQEVLDLAIKTQACNSTSPAAALMPFYKEKEVMKTIILVTDEEENTNCEGFSFLDLYKKYSEEVFPAKLVFISFLSSQTSPGQMVSKLRQANFNPMQFRLSRDRPDLTKLDNILGQLSMKSVEFERKLNQTQAQLEEDGLEKLFTAMSIASENYTE